mmetsp:Transcript_102753/g.329494  ORF Transcript_102753/g.329494 Transcript_102753/m.329494 type:complete len:555 (-) Transcript_102753:442-2106(-)
MARGPGTCLRCTGGKLSLRHSGYLGGYICGRRRTCDLCRGGIDATSRAWSCSTKCGWSVCEGCAVRGGLRTAASPSSATSPSSAASPAPATVPPPRGPAPLERKIACRYGSTCYQVNAEHLEIFAHPGDPSYRLGLVTLEAGQKPDLETLWEIFVFYDPRESGHLSRGEFGMAVQEVSARLKLKLDEDDAWAEAGGEDQGHVSFVHFAVWSSRAGLRIPVGLDIDVAAPRACRVRSPEGMCKCANFCRRDGSRETWACNCGHGERSHCSESAQMTLQVMLLSSRPPHWMPGKIGLVPVADTAVLAQFQFLLDVTHLEVNNWTRDRGCSLHGVNGCSGSCAFSNRAPVPRGYRLAGVWRNQNPALWARYSLMRATVLHECSRRGCVPCPVESCKPAFDGLDSSSLLAGANEWRLFHGSSEAACRAICARNFNLGLAGSGASWRAEGAETGSPLYGRGVYLSERITKADEYSGRTHAEPSSKLHFALFCRAIGGRPTVCVENEIDPEALRNQVLCGPYHSVLGDRVSKLRKPFREIVVYDKDQAYPEFLLSYTRLM